MNVTDNPDGESGADDGTSQGEQALDPSSEKVSLKALISKMANPLALSTERLGPIQARTMTSGMEAAFLTRQPSVEGVPDLDLVRTYMGCTTGIPLQNGEVISAHLSEEDASKLTDADVRAFADAYLRHFVKPAELNDPIAQMAEYVREQHQRAKESLEKWGKAIKGSIDRFSSSSEIMRNWKSLQDNIEGPAEMAKRELQKLMGPAMSGSDALRRALSEISNTRARATDGFHGSIDSLGKSAMDEVKKAIATDQWQKVPGLPIRDAVAKAIEGAAQGEAKRASDELRKTGESGSVSWFDPFSADKMPRIQAPAPFHDPVPGRIAEAVEGINEASGRMESAIETIVEHAGEASALITNVTDVIKTESSAFQEKSERQTRSAMRYAKLSLAVAAVALLASAVLSGLGYRADRIDAASGDAVSEQTIAQVQRQNANLEELIKAQQALLDEARLQTKAANELRDAVRASAVREERAAALREAGH